MNTWSWGKMIKQLVVVALLFGILYGLVDLLYWFVIPARELLLPVPSPAPAYTASPDPEIRYWQEELAGAPPLTRTVAFSVTEASITVDLSLWFTREHPLVGQVIGGLGDHLPAFVQAAFGQVSVDGLLDKSDYASPLWIVDPRTQLVHIHIPARKAMVREGDITIAINRLPAADSFTPTHDEVTIQTTGVRLKGLYPMPDKGTEGLAYLYRDAPKTIGQVIFWFGPETAWAGDTSAEPTVESRQGFLNRLGRLPDLPLLYGLVAALPLLIYWWWVSYRQKAPPAFAAALAKSVSGLLLFHFLLYFLNQSGGLDYDLRSLFNNIRLLVEGLSVPFSMLHIYPLLGGEAPYWLEPVLVGVLVPAMLIQRSGQPSASAGRFAARLIRALAALPLVAGIAIPAAYAGYLVIYEEELEALADLPWLVDIGLGSLLAVLIWIVFAALYRQIAQPSPRPGVPLLATWLTLAILLVSDYSPEGLEAIILLVLTVVMGTALLFALAAVAYGLIRQATPALSIPRWARWLLVLLAMGLAIPMRILVRKSDPLAYYYDVVNLAYRLDGLILFIWLGGVVWLLYQQGKNRTNIDTFTRVIGILGASSLLFSPTVGWFYIPVNFLLGWFLLSRLVRPAGHWRELQPFFKRVVRERLALLDQILDLNAAENAYKELRKKLGGKLTAGELTFEEYDNKLEERKRSLNDLRQKDTLKGRTVKDMALTFGPYPSAWQNGLHGAGFALVFALPWITLFLRDFLSGSVSAWQTYPLWDFATDLLNVVCKWGAYGFVFGYFYPYLRGNNGLQKGLGLFLVSVLPALPLMGLFNVTTGDWQASLFWVLQVFIQCMLLGLVAFDYAILRQGRYDWQMLLQVHGLTPVGISISTILAAVGVAVTTLLTSQATNLVTLALQFVLPQVLPTPMPTPTPTLLH